ncbi:helicase associated domain-containing protein [Kitasatospora sp. NPDC088351]|uniref:helicase associated domain-containing protein n=1 Tax=Kitasatospora sp. NPDC088351 TaxID=3155180 RepID=UPI003440446F
MSATTDEGVPPLSTDPPDDPPAPATDPVYEGEQLGRWVQAQRAGWPGPEEDQRDLLSAVGIEEDQELVAAKAATEAKPAVSRVDRFAQGLAALAQFVGREGHAAVKRPHKEPLETVEAGPGGEEQAVVSHFVLGTWLNNQKARRVKLTPGQLAQLAEHGVEWAGWLGRAAGAVRRAVGRRGPAAPGRAGRRVLRHPAGGQLAQRQEGPGRAAVMPVSSTWGAAPCGVRPPPLPYRSSRGF